MNGGTMQIDLGPAASRLLAAQARAADMELTEWIEHLAVEHEDGQNGARLLATPTAYRRADVLNAIFDALEEHDAEDRVYVMTIKRLLADADSVSTTQIGKLFASLGLEKRSDANGSHYSVGAVREAIIEHTQ